MLRRLVERVRASRAARAWTRYGDLRGNRLAAAVSFYGFVSLFPLLVLAAAIVSAFVGVDGIAGLQTVADENLPGLRLDVAEFSANAGAIGVIGGLTLLWTGLGWVDATRASVRSMWRLDDEPGNLVTRKLADLAALVGLGVVMVVSWGATLLVSAATDEVLDLAGVTGSAGDWFGRGIGLVLAIASGAVLFGYLLTGLPRIAAPLRVLVPAALLGGLVLEVLKQFVAGFIVGPAADNAYAAFAVPLALLAWIYVVARLLMVLAAALAEWATE